MVNFSKCTKCNNEFAYRVEKQLAGFREKEYLICPRCGEVIGSSMEYEYYQNVNKRVANAPLEQIVKQKKAVSAANISSYNGGKNM
ncbi:MAG: hypothetical protein K2K21_08705, partial [Lachnospiraceae bacterium]|nr:hypothetical protein [Lachnospiraceae bacterium]